MLGFLLLKVLEHPYLLGIGVKRKKLGLLVSQIFMGFSFRMSHYTSQSMWVGEPTLVVAAPFSYYLSVGET